MLVKVIIRKDGTRTHEVIERTLGEQCSRVFELNVGEMVSDEKIGPDCDASEEGFDL